MNHSTADIRQFLSTAFSDEELSELCFDYFPEVYDQFTTGMTKRQKILFLIEYCSRRELIPNLLAAIKKVRPRQFAERFSGITTSQEAPRIITEEANNVRQVFVSHANEDFDFAHRLAENLETQGWRVWIAPDNIYPGEKWVEAINRGLTESSVFVLVLTPSAIRSQWVISETNVAIQLEHQGQLRFFPLEVQDCSIPPLWSSYQRISFRKSFEEGLITLLAAIEGNQKTDQQDSKKTHIPSDLSKNKDVIIIGAIGVAVITALTFTLRAVLSDLVGNYFSLVGAIVLLFCLFIYREYSVRSEEQRRKLVLIGIIIFILVAVLAYLFRPESVGSPNY